MTQHNYALRTTKPVKVPIVVRSAYTIFVEYHADQPGREMWMHCDVHRWSPSVARDIHSDFETFLEAYGAPVFAIASPVDSKHVHWLRMYGFTFHSPFLGQDDCHYETWTRAPKGNNELAHRQR